MNADSVNSTWFQSKLTALLAMLSGLAMLLVSWWHLDTANAYRPLPQQVFLDVYNRPIGAQDLLTHTYHNPDYLTDEDSGGPAADFTKEALLSMFNYDKFDLVSGGMLARFMLWCSEDEAYTLYRDAFVSMGQQKIVLAQDAIVEAKIVGDLEYIGRALRGYETTSGLSMQAETMKFEGTMVVTVRGDKLYPTVYSISVLVQRAMIQDKIHGYQLIELEMK